MNPEIKERWVAALRSGTYKQGEGALRNENNEYCCLGVLCDLYVQSTGEKWQPPAPNSGDYYLFHNDAALLPDKVVDWAGLVTKVVCGANGSDITVPVPKEDLSEGDELTTTLAELNDDGNSFERIASIIETEL